MSASKFPRRPPRLDRIFQLHDAPVYFVTFSTYRRSPWLAQDAVHAGFTRFAAAAEVRFNVAVGRYVIMPDHVHLFICGGQDFILGRWIGSLKQALARSAGKSAAGGTPWQEGFFDRLLRCDESMSAQWEYMRQNPVRAGLVAQAEDWSYQGEIVRLDRV